MSTPASPPPSSPSSPIAGGFFLVLPLVAGFFIGLAQGVAMLGTVIGLGVGLVLLGVVWAIDRRRRG